MTSEESKRRLLSKWKTARRDDRAWQDEFDAQQCQIEALETALREVQRWMLGPLVYGTPMRDPRKILQIVERALEP